MDFPGGSDGKESGCNARDLGLIPGLRRSPGGGHGSPLQYFCLEKSHGERSGGLQSMESQSDTTEQLSTAQHSYIIHTDSCIHTHTHTHTHMDNIENQRK